MPSVSKIPQNVNRYAIKCAYEIRNKSVVEYGKGIDFYLDKIKTESLFIEGAVDKIKYPFDDNAPKDLFVHNHPKQTKLNLGDLFVAVVRGIKKVYASNKKGYTSVDFTTVKKSVSMDRMYNWLLEEKTDQKMMFNKLAEKFNSNLIYKFIPKSIKDFIIYSIYNSHNYKKVKEFAKFSGATFSDVKWGDYKQLNKSKT